MEPVKRPNRPLVAGEIETLNGYLDFHRATLLGKVGGVSDEDLRRCPIPTSTITLLSLVKHLAYVERWWFQNIFAGRETALSWSDQHPAAGWRIEPDDTTAMILQLYREETNKSREIVRQASDLDELSKNKAQISGRQVNLRTLLVHVLEETARHNGHADLLREAIDGQTGE